MAAWKFGDEMADPEGRFSGPASPFLIKDGSLWEFRPQQAIDFIRTAARDDERLVVLAGLVAWMLAPSGVINTKSLRSAKTSAQSFVYDAMVVKASEELDDAFYSARVYQLQSGDRTVEQLLKQDPLKDCCFDLFFVLGGFDALLKVSVEDLKEKLQSQSEPVAHVRAMVAKFLGRPRKGPTPTWGVEATANAVSADLQTTDGKSPYGTTPSTIKNHWRSLSQSAPLIFAAGEINDGDFLKLFFRDPTLGPGGNYDRNVSWLNQFLARTGEVAQLLLAAKMIKAWPPPTQYFQGQGPTLI